MTDDDEEQRLEQAVEDSIRAVISHQNQGDLMVDFLVIASVIPAIDDNTTSYIYKAREAQSVHASLGLVAMAKQYFKRQIGYRE